MSFGSGTWDGPASSSSSGAYSISDILYHALRKARVTGGVSGGVVQGAGRTASSDQISDAFFLFKALLDSWRARGWTILNVSRNLFTLTSGTAEYSIGANSADFTWATRPSRIEYAGRVDASSGVELPIDIYSIQRWSEILLKSTSSLPFAILYEPTLPNGTITCYPVPSQADQLALYLWDTSADPATATDTIDLSPGFLQTLITCLALDCVETFGTSVLFDAKAFDRLERSARNGKRALEVLTASSPELNSDVPGSRRTGIDVRGLFG